jgi:putative ABC transport system permease protein
MPSIRATVTAINDRRIADMQELPEGAWFLRGDRNLSFTGRAPRGQPHRRGRVVAGRL